MGSPARGVRITIEYISQDSIGPLGEMVLLKEWSKGDIPLSHSLHNQVSAIDQIYTRKLKGKDFKFMKKR